MKSQAGKLIINLLSVAGGLITIYFIYVLFVFYSPTKVFVGLNRLATEEIIYRPGDSVVVSASVQRLLTANVDFDIKLECSIGPNKRTFQMGSLAGLRSEPDSEIVHFVSTIGIIPFEVLPYLDRPIVCRINSYGTYYYTASSIIPVQKVLYADYRSNPILVVK